MTISELKKLTQRIKDDLATLTDASGKGRLYEHYDDGFSVNWQFENAASVQEVEERVEALAVWIWSLKDHLKQRLKNMGENERDVEDYVNQCRYLPICADIANHAKHGRLHSSRSGRFARLADGTMRIGSGMTLTSVQNKIADVIVNINDPDGVKYQIHIRDKDGKYMGDAFVMLHNSWKEWGRFMRRMNELRRAIP